MIISHVGTPGSGKSYEAVVKILDNIKLGRRVYTNIEGLDQPRQRRAIADYCNIYDYQLEKCLNFLTQEQAKNFWRHCETGSLIVIDEIHKLFSNRDWSSPDNVGFTNYCSTHRHDGMDIIFITQDIEKVDKHARSLIEWTYFYRKMNQFGQAVSSRYTVYSFMGDNHQGKALGTNVKKYNPKIFPCYSSYFADGIQEKTFQKHFNVLKHPVFYAIPVVLGLVIYLFSQSSFKDGKLINVPTTESIMGTKTASAAGHDSGDHLQSDKVQPFESKVSRVADVNAIVKWILPGGKIIYTNNGIAPFGAKKVAEL